MARPAGCHRLIRLACLGLGLALFLATPRLVPAQSLPTSTSEAEGPAPVETEPPRASAYYTGVPAPGLQVVLHGDDSTGSGIVHHRWVQTAGPPVALADPASATTQFIVPDTYEVLEFQLIVASASGVDTMPVRIPVEGQVEDAPTSDLRADAGDDQTGTVGQRITLNGIRSARGETLGYRWLQVGGPDVLLALADRHTYAFVPHEPGLYRFALVVARESTISEPDTVEVRVVMPPLPSANGTAPAPVTSRSPTPALSSPPRTLVRVAAEALGSIPAGPEAGEDLADCFAGVADRLDLYASYDELFNELSRRLEPIVPADPAGRQVWNDRLFAPMTLHLIEVMRVEGLDLQTVESRTGPLSQGQRDRLAIQFQAMAEGFRATSSAR